MARRSSALDVPFHADIGLLAQRRRELLLRHHAPPDPTRSLGSGISEVMRIRAFLASPGDTVEERKLVADAIEDLNRNEGRESDFHIDLWVWEKDSFPSVGEDGQDALNKQVYPYHIFIGIMSQRFGSPTLRANSGTEEEFDRAYERYRYSAGQLQILFYFKNPMVRLFDVDIHQAGLVASFRKRLQSLGVFYGTFEDADQLRLEFRNHLRKAVKRIRQQVGDITSGNTSEPRKSVERSLPDWMPETQRIYPQWASHRDVNLEGSRNFELSGEFASEIHVLPLRV